MLILFAGVFPQAPTRPAQQPVQDVDLDLGDHGTALIASQFDVAVAPYATIIASRYGESDARGISFKGRGGVECVAQMESLLAA